MTSDNFTLEDIPPGVPGRVAICEWCGKYVNNYNVGGTLQWCPYCSKGTLRNNCAHCGTPIPVPPQLKCLSCGGWLTIMPMIDTPNGPMPKEIKEPDPERRKLLESAGNNWWDVIRGKADGPQLALPRVEGQPPQGWSRRQFAELLGQANIEQGAEAELAQQLEERRCPRCGLRSFGLPEQLQKCLLCGTPFNPPQGPQPGQNLDNGPAPA